MSRPAGVRNQDFEEKRHALLEKIADFLLDPDVDRPSLRQLAIAAEASEPTLRHYFGNRSGVVVAVLEMLAARGAPLREVVSQPCQTCADAVDSYIDFVAVMRKDHRYAQLHAMGIRESLSDEDVQQAYVEYVVKPGVDAVASKLVRSPGGPADYQSARYAAAMLISASTFAVLHQEVIGGKKFMPIEIDSYLAHVKNWVGNGLAGSSDS
ncbi:TetR/AcrR family transcriptional regulator [Henriciella litoralis]|uniref:TetR/AcrR family transcriptional regulator n=1 Tax=Henriciella litoralis TaxID=568102 RepID=UPI00111BE807|nr:TetR/AcrR family transcriptional regulator [Henriciella litoralis]